MFHSIFHEKEYYSYEATMILIMVVKGQRMEIKWCKIQSAESIVSVN